VEAVARARPPHAHEHGDEHHHHEHEHDEPPVQPGDQVRIDLAVSELKRQRLPELDDAFAREVGEETFLGLRVAVRKRLEAARERQADAMVETKLLDQIVDRASFEMARGPVDRAVASRIDRVVLERMIHGEDEESARAAAEAGRDEIRRIVERDAKAWLIVEKVAKKEKIFAFEDDVAKEIARIAAERGATPTKVREVYESEGMIPELRANILERKVLDFLREHGRVVDAKEEAAAGSGAGDQGA
jgi:trigger factor